MKLQEKVKERIAEIIFSPYQVSVYSITFFVKYNRFWKKINSKQWEPQTFEIFNKFLDSKHSMIDVGAWIGPTTLFGASIAKKCYSIEPDPIAYKILKKNVKINKKLKEKIELFNICINNKEGNVFLKNKSDFGNSVSSIMLLNSKNSNKVKGVQLETFMEEHKITDCNFVKMDVEGAEIMILPNIKHLLKKQNITIHLSLHPQNFQKHKKDMLRIIDTLSIYKNIYDNKFNKIRLDDLQFKLANKRGFDIVATNLDV